MNEVDTTIGSMVKITGNITSEGNVVIHGTVEKGEVNIGGHLTVGETAEIKGNIKAENVTILGKVMGNVKSDQDLVIGVSGYLKGDAEIGNEFVVERGGVFLGKSSMNENVGEEDNSFDDDGEEEIEDDVEEDDEI